MAIKHELAPLDSKDRFNSITELKQAQSKLLQEMQGIDMSRSCATSYSDEIREFLRKASASGEILNEPSERKQAQGILEYWAANLYSSARNASDRLSHEETVLREFDEKKLLPAIEKADRFLISLSAEDRAIAERILLATIHHERGLSSYNAATVSLEQLSELGEPARIEHLAERLIDTGVARRTETDTYDSDTITLASLSLTRTWPRLAELLDERRQFSDAASQWQRRGRNDTQLLQQSQIEEVKRYPNLSQLEQDFLDSSQKQATSKRARFWVTAVIFLLLLSSLVTFQLWQYRKSNRNLEQSSAKLASLQQELKERLRETEALHEKAREEAENAKVNLQLFKSQYLEALNAQQSMEEQLSALSAIVGIIKSQDADALPEELVEQAARYDREILKKSQYVKQDEEDAIPGPHPGTRIGPKGEQQFGTASFILLDGQDQKFIATPEFVIGGSEGDAVLQFAKWGKVGHTIARIESIPNSKFGQVSELAFARLTSDENAANTVPGFGEIKGFADTVAAGDGVVAFGATSGLRRGKVLRVNEDGTVITERMSRPGDAGAPVMTEDGKLIGIVIASNGEDQTVVKRVSRGLLEQLGFKLLTSE